MKPIQTIHLSSLALLATLTACGGGGDPVATPTPTTPAATAQPVPASTSLAVAGTAIHATALAGRAVDAKCKKGSGSATTGSDGSYALTIASGELPCLVRVTEADASTLHAVAQGTGLSAAANITPLTQLVVARLAGADPAAYYAAFDSTAAAFVTGAAVTAAQSSVVKTVQAGGISLTGFGDLMAVAASTVQGGVQSAALLQMDSALNASGTKLATLTLAVVNTTPATAAGLPVATTGVAMLPPDLLLKPAAAGCAALRSGSFRAATLANGLTRVSRMVINASTPAITNADGTSTKLLANGACRYTLDDASKSELVVSQSGVLQMRVPDGATFVVAIAIPEQLHDLAEMAGVWNYASYLPNHTGIGATPYRGGIATATWSNAGSLLTGSTCGDNDAWDFTVCKDAGNTSRLLVNADGGFDHIDISIASLAGRAFIYQSGSGDLLYVRTYFYGGWDIGTRQRSLALPGTEASTIVWKFPVDTLNKAGAIEVVTDTFDSNNAVENSWSFKEKDEGRDNEHLEKTFVNNPLQGFSFQAGGPTTSRANPNGSFDKSTTLDLRGMGFFPFLNQTQKSFRLRVHQPKP